VYEGLAGLGLEHNKQRPPFDLGFIDVGFSYSHVSHLHVVIGFGASTGKGVPSTK